MRSALYYPHTHISNAGLIKTALLLWDQLQYIVPSKRFTTSYADKNIAQAMEIIGRGHAPTRDEQMQAHRRLEELVNGQLPAQFFLDVKWDRDGSSNYEEPYEMYPEKLIPDSWRLLQESQLAGRRGFNSHIPMTQSAGLTIMSILADSCAGTTRSRVTDRGAAYATIANLVHSDPKLSDFRSAEAHGFLVPISVRVIDASKVDLRALIDLRVREGKEGGNTFRDLRHRYIQGLENYVKQIAAPNVTRSDVKEIQRQFEFDMKQDLRDLKSELGYARTDVLSSKEFITTILATSAVATSWVTGNQLPLSDVFTLGGAPVAIGGLVALSSKYTRDREAIMKRHPMAYLYAASRAGLIERRTI